MEKKERWWIDYPWRVVQTNFRDIDMKDLDAKKFVQDIIDFGANTVMVSFGGTLANYPSKITDHFHNSFANDDCLLKLTRLCHENGIKVIARTDFSKMHYSIFQKHQDWAYRDSDGEVVDSNGFISTCQNAGFQGQFMDEVITEILSEFNVDGIYCNMGGFMVVDYNLKLHGPCHCESCRKAFRTMTGLELPEKDLPFASFADKAVAAYQKYKSQVIDMQKKRIEKLIHSINPDAAYCSMDYVRLESNTEIGRALPAWQYSASSNVRTAKGSGKEVENASVDMMGFCARGASVGPELNELRLWQSLANFGGVDFFVMGRLDNREDRSSFERVREVFNFAKKNEFVYRGLRNLAKVLVLRTGYQIPIPEERGWIRILTELHIPFEEALVSSVSSLDKYELIILPDKEFLSENTRCQLDDFVEKGGKLIVSGRIPFSSSKNILSLGLNRTGSFVDSVGSYAIIEKKPFFPSLKDRYIIPLGKGYFPYVCGSAVSCNPIMPPQRFGPPEVCYACEDPTSYHAITFNDYGKGMGVCIPWNVGSCYYNEGNDIWFLFLKDVLEQILDIKSLSQTLSSMVEVTIGSDGRRTVVQLVNGTGHFGNSFFAPVTIADVKISIPWNGKEPSCKSYVHESNVVHEFDNNVLILKIKRLGAYEVIEIQ